MRDMATHEEMKNKGRMNVDVLLKEKMEIISIGDTNRPVRVDLTVWLLKGW
jgi:hypothetical protein